MISSSSSSNSSSLPLARATKRSIVDNNNNNKQNNHKTILMMAVLMVCMLRFVLHEKQTMASYFDNDDSSASTTTTSCQTQQHQRRQNNNNNNYTQDTYSSFSNTICQALSHGALTPSSLWKSNLEAILQASIHPYDQERRIHKEWQQDLLHLLAPTLLERSIINLPSMQQVKDLVEMVDARRNYLLYQQLQQQQQPTLNTTTSTSIVPAPLQVAVMGGSVPEGRGCDGFPAELSDWMANITRNHGGFTAMERNIRGKDCSWPFRLQLLADFFLGQGVVSIHNLAVGGTASGLALPTLEYRLYRNAELVEHGGPDVIINGFAVNDNMPAWGQDPNTTSRMEHWDGAFWQTQSFLNYGMNKAKPCRKPKPVVIYLDDYLGNQNGDVLLAEDQRSDSVRMTSDLNGLLYVSSPFPIKPFVMAKEPETSFSPKWTNKGNKRIVEGHYYQTEHQHVAYSLAYAILKSTVEHCVMDEFKILHQIKESSILSQSTKTLLALYPFPPTIDRTQALSTISRSWKDNAETLVYGEEKYCQSANAYADPCPFGFVATPAGTTPNQKALSSYLGRFIKENTGWRTVNDMRFGWQNKIGFVANTIGASVLLTIPNIQNPIKVITVHFMKSYGEKWVGSAASFDINVYESAGDAAAATASQPSVLSVYNQSFTLSGEWEQQYSINVHEQVELEPNSTRIGNTVTLRITLIGGQEFKIVTMLMCSR